MMKNLLTTAEVAKRLGITPRRVVVLASQGRFPGAIAVHARLWLIPEAAVAKFKRRPPGRPVA